MAEPWRTSGAVAWCLELNCGETWEEAFDAPCPPHVAALAFALPGEVIAEEDPR
jgi:hypothetical protein